MLLNNKTEEEFSVYTASGAVYEVLSELGEDEARFEQYLTYALAWARKHHITRANEVFVLQTTMDSSKQIAFPEDMVDWSKVGVKCGNTIKTFLLDENITKNCQLPADKREVEACDPIDTVEVLQDYLYGFADNYFTSYNDFKTFGWAVHGNRLGYFNVDRRSRVFNFKETIPSDKEIYIEYISDGINVTGKTLINPIAFELCKLWIHWKRKQHNDRYSRWEKLDAKRNYQEELMDYDLATLDLGLSDIRDAMRQGYRMTPKN